MQFYFVYASSIIEVRHSCSRGRVEDAGVPQRRQHDGLGADAVFLAVGAEKRVVDRGNSSGPVWKFDVASGRDSLGFKKSGEPRG